MAKVKIEATKLADASVSYISLVKRGANRIPFRIIKSQKQEKEMINLGTIFKSVKKEEAKPEIAIMGLVVSKEDYTPEVKDAIKKAGLDFDFTEEREDGTVVIKETADALDVEGLTVIKMSDDLIVLTKGFDPYSDTMTFMDTANAQGFYPAIGNAMDALRTVTSKALRESSSPDEAVTKMEGLLKEFNQYVLDAARTIPTIAFKADSEVAEVIKAAKAKVKPAGAGAGAGTGEDGDGMDGDEGKAKAKKDEDAGAVENKGSTTEVVKTDTPTGEDMGAVVKATIDAAMASINETITGITTAVAGVTKQVSEMAEAQKVLASKVDEVESVAKSADEALKGVIVGGEPAGEVTRIQTTQKSGEDDEDPRTGQFDTAFIRKNARTKR